MIPPEEISNFELFRDCVSAPLIEKFANDCQTPRVKRRGTHGRKKSQPVNSDTPAVKDDTSKDAEELGEFIDYIATEVFTSLSADLRTLTYSTYINTPSLQTRYLTPLSAFTESSILQSIPSTVNDTLSTYKLLPATTTPPEFLLPIINTYLTTLTTAPPPPSQTKDLASGCEICERSHVPLTYHHLIPRFVHEKAVKRGWHTRDQLNNVAWLCRQCHSFVHHIASHEELARKLYTVDLLMEREEVRRFAAWVGRVRWKAR